MGCDLSIFFGLPFSKNRQAKSTLLMMGHVAFHAGIEGREAGRRVGGEVVKAGVREEVEQFGTGHLFGVSSGVAQDTQDTRTATVLRGRDLLQIVERPVHYIAVDVIDLHAFGARSDKGLPHEMMTETAGVLPHIWIPRMTPFPVTRLMRARFNFFAIGIVEAAVRAAVKGFATHAFRWDLFVNGDAPQPPKGGDFMNCV